LVVHITPAERALIQLLVDGRSIHEIADRLRLDEADVNLRLKALFIRMGLSIQAEATAAHCCRGSDDRAICTIERGGSAAAHDANFEP
jgi:DNA-binding NarL/FixJ family response regulator